MDNINISNMSILDLENISDKLISDFDDFWTVSTLKNELENSRSKYLVAKLNNQVVGFGGIWKAVDDIHITNIVVNKNFRRKNIGSTILENLINLAKQDSITSITLEVNCTNIPAIKLYEKFGFKNVGLRKKYYKNTYDALIMSKDLDKYKN